MVVKEVVERKRFSLVFARFHLPHLQKHNFYSFYFLEMGRVMIKKGFYSDEKYQEIYLLRIKKEASG